MGVPAFYRWLSEKYPKIVQDVLEERVHTDATGTRLPFDSTKPNPSGLEADHLYIDMNGIIHPCSHPEQGPQPTSEEEMYENVCRYVDRLFRVVRPRKLLYLAIDGVAPRAKMNQQRSRRFRSAQEARELCEVEEHVRSELTAQGHVVPPIKKPWDSNVITPGTTFMLRLSDYIRFYIRKRLSTDRAWQHVRVIFSDASIPGEGEHKIMNHIRLQRSQTGYDPNLVHVLHGLDADLIMLALATHETHFYILREVVTFGRKSQEQLERRQQESGFTDAQRQLDEAAGSEAMTTLLENQQKQLQRVSIPILREYLHNEFADCCNPSKMPFPTSLERLIDDIVFLCFFVGNDFLPHLPSLDIRDGALDYLFNVYKRILPTLGDYITNHGGKVNLSHVDVILAEVGAIEDYVFQMKHANEERDKQYKEQAKQRRKQQQQQRNQGGGGGRPVDAPPSFGQPADDPPKKVMGRAARILEKRKRQETSNGSGSSNNGNTVKKEEQDTKDQSVALQRGGQAKEQKRMELKAKKMLSSEENTQAALELKKTLLGGSSDPIVKKEEGDPQNVTIMKQEGSNGDSQVKAEDDASMKKEEDADEVVADAIKDDDVDDDDDEEAEAFPEIHVPELNEADKKRFKDKVKGVKDKQLDEFAQNVQDKVRLHEAGWKDRYYADKCKADDVANHGGREHLFRSYVMGLCWVMKYYYDGCPSWTWYFPFHYAPFASDLRNIERFDKDCKNFDMNEPFKPVEQLMAVLPEDSSHAIPKAARWLMSDPESPIIDFYPKDVPCDPNGKAMPWLWVVLLPFIDEERLLENLKPSMEKWTKEELLCNTKGMDDGYMFVHKNHPFSEKFSVVYASSNGSKSGKIRLLECAANGSIRKPLSNEVHPVDDDAKIPPPASSVNISRSSHDNLFLDEIDPNEALCVAFTEPLKLSHKSIMLPGARPPPPTLTGNDLRINRPRLNRGGGTIANMGVSNGASHQQGYGSMNINSYERDLAQRTGRGGQMHQAGTRAWGAMEPTPKRPRYGGNNGQQPPPSYPPNPLIQSQHGNGGHQPQRPGNNYNRPPWQQQHQSHGGYQQQGYNNRPSHQNQPPSYGHQQQQQQRGQQNQWQPQAPNYGHQQQQQHRPPYQQQYGGGNRHGSAPPPPPPPRQHHHQQQQQQQRQGHSFRSHNQSSSRPGGQHQQRHHQQQNNNRQNSSQSRVNPNIMNNLRSQLASTLNKNRQGQGHGGRR